MTVLMLQVLCRVSETVRLLRMNRQSDRQRDRQTDRQTDGQTDRQMDSRVTLMLHIPHSAYALNDKVKKHIIVLICNSI